MDKIPFVSFRESHTQIRPEILTAFETFFDEGWFILGKKVEIFEKEYADLNHVKHSVGVSNGLDALHIALRTLNVGQGDEVIVPSNTFIATVLAVSYVGATPIFVEPDPLTYNIDPSRIEAAITKNTKAIIPVHLYGQACAMTEIMDIANHNSLYVIEDNAQAHLAAWKNQLTGSWGHINATSFYPGKNLGALGDGGAITTNSDEYAKQAKVFRNYGSEKKYHNEVVGYNMRLDECQAAFLSIKLKYLSAWTKQRQEIAKWYDQLLAGISQIVIPKCAPDATHVYHLYVIQTPQRDALQQYLNERGIATLIHYPIPPHLQSAYKKLGYKRGDFPIAEQLADNCLSLPMWPGLKQNQVEYIAASIKDFLSTSLYS